MLILSRVCVDFRSPEGVSLFEVKPSMLNTFQEAPDAIQQDPIFSLLVSDGSLEAVVSASRKKALENDPIQDTDPSGKSRKAGRGKDKGAVMAASASSTDESLSDSLGTEKKGKINPSVTVTKDLKVPAIEEKTVAITTDETDKTEKKAVRK